MTNEHMTDHRLKFETLAGNKLPGLRRAQSSRYHRLVPNGTGFSSRPRFDYYKPMRKVNVKDMTEAPWSSLKGKFGGASKEVSVALGRKPESTEMIERHRRFVEAASGRPF